jgi:hypothetical protein
MSSLNLRDGLVVQKILHHRDGGHQIAIVELIGDVPTHRTELPPLLYNRMEEAEPKRQLLERYRLVTCLDHLIVDVTKAVLQIRDKALWWLAGDLHGQLEEMYGEVAAWACGKKQAETGVRNVDFEIRHDALKVT